MPAVAVLKLFYCLTMMMNMLLMMTKLVTMRIAMMMPTVTTTIAMTDAAISIQPLYVIMLKQSTKHNCPLIHVKQAFPRVHFTKLSHSG